MTEENPLNPSANSEPTGGTENTARGEASSTESHAPADAAISESAETAGGQASSEPSPEPSNQQEPQADKPLIPEESSPEAGSQLAGESETEPMKPSSIVSDYRERATEELHTAEARSGVITTSQPSTNAVGAAPVEVERVPIEAALGCGWQGFKKSWALFLGINCLFLLIMAAPVVVAFLISDIVKRNLFLNFCLSAVSAVAPLFFAMGCMKAQLRYPRNEPFTSDDFVSVVTMSVYYAFMHLCRSVLIVIGCIFFIVPGVIIAVRLDFAEYFIIDKRMNPFKAMAESWRVTKDSALMIMLFWFAIGFVNWLGALAFGIGMCFTFWITGIAKGYVYDRLVATAPPAKSKTAQTEGATQ
ncbi:MAG TPA: hypothetical protein V6C97_15505 [Oculatellaceae cyanobacterium]